MKFLLMIPLLLAAFPSGSAAQLTLARLVEGGLVYTWSNEWSVSEGEVLVARQVLLNPTDSPIVPPIVPCDDLEAPVPITEEARTCSDPEETLAPGDSIWAELRGVVLEAPRSTSDGEPFQPRQRVPYVLELGDALERGIVPGEIEMSLVSRALQSGYPGSIPIRVSPEAAEAMIATSPVLFMRIEPGSGGDDHELQWCWATESADRSSGPRCEYSAIPLDADPVSLGADLHVAIERAAEFGRRLQRPRPRREH